MDNIQFWIYVVFAAIYFIAKALKKSPKDKPATRKPKSPVQTADDQDKPYQKPKSFEELLEEFTGGGQSSREEEVEVEEPEPFAEAFEKLDKPKERLYGEEEKIVRQEGSRRVFADEESKKVYEESIKRAEGANLEFKRDEHFLKGVERKEEGSENELAREIREGLSNVNEAQKAVIYSEILTRKY